MTGSRYEAGSAGSRARDGVEAPVRPVLSGRRGVRQRLGMIVVATLAVTVLAAGIGLGGSDLVPAPSAGGESPGASGSGSPRPSTSAPPPTPVAQPPRPTPMNESGCFPADPADLPQIRLSTTDPRLGIANGTEGPPGWSLATPQTSAWPVPRAGAALIVQPTSEIVVTPNDDECIRYVVAEYLGADDLGGVPTNLGLGEMNVSPPRAEVVLGSVPIGDWIVRVVAYFSTGVAGNEDDALVERFFRVTTNINPAVSPEVTPAVPCAVPAPGEPVTLALQIGDGEPVVGVDLDTYEGDVTKTGALVTGSVAEPLTLVVNGDVCATSWTVQWLDASGSPMMEVIQENSAENPYLVSQNRMVLTPEQEIFGHLAIKASVNLGMEQTIRAAWELNRSGPPLPTIELQGPDGQPVIGVPGCGAGWNLADGRSSWELCQTTPIPETVRLLTLRSGDIVTILEPGLTVSSWSVQCGTRGGPDGTEFQYGNCDLGGGMGGPMRFLPYPGRSMIQVFLSMENVGENVYAPYYIELLVED